MRKVGRRKTKLVPRLVPGTTTHRQHRLRRWTIFGASLIGCLLVATLLTLVIQTRATSPKSQITLAGTTFRLEVTKTLSDQERGLGGRSGLAAHAGMLFAYQGTAQRCMWMKDMKFDIDIVWIDSSRKVTKIESSLSPATYPQIYCADAQNVVELPAGTAQQYDLKVGQTLDI